MAVGIWVATVVYQARGLSRRLEDVQLWYYGLCVKGVIESGLGPSISVSLRLFRSRRRPMFISSLIGLSSLACASIIPTMAVASDKSVGSRVWFQPRLSVAVRLE